MLHQQGGASFFGPVMSAEAFGFVGSSGRRPSRFPSPPRSWKSWAWQAGPGGTRWDAAGPYGAQDAQVTQVLVDSDWDWSSGWLLMGVGPKFTLPMPDGLR